MRGVEHADREGHEREPAHDAAQHGRDGPPAVGAGDHQQHGEDAEHERAADQVLLRDQAEDSPRRAERERPSPRRRRAGSRRERGVRHREQEHPA